MNPSGRSYRDEAAAFQAHHEAETQTLIERAWNEAWQPLIDLATTRAVVPDDLNPLRTAWNDALRALVIPKLGEMYRVGALAGMQQAGQAPPPSQWVALTAAGDTPSNHDLYVAYHDKLNEYQDAVNAGMDPAKAEAIYNEAQKLNDEWLAAVNGIPDPELEKLLQQVGELATSTPTPPPAPEPKTPSITAPTEEEVHASNVATFVKHEWDLVDAKAAEFMQFAENRLVGVGENAWATARDALTEGMLAGDSVPQLADRLQEQLDFSRNRALTIARTETHTATQEGRIDGVRALGPELTPQFKQWVAVMDDRTRESHAEADGQVVPIDEPFIVDGEEWDVPGDINCRCDVIFVESAEGVDTEGQWVDGQWVVPNEPTEPDVGSPAPVEALGAAPNEWVHNQFDDLINALADEVPVINQPMTMQEAAEAYMSSSYHLNSMLRGVSENVDNWDVMYARERWEIHALDRLFERAPPLDSTVHTFRGGWFPNLKIGGTFVDDGYGSTSASIETAKAFVGGKNEQLYMIVMPEGTQVAPLRFLAPNGLGVEEQEWLLPRGTAYRFEGYKTYPSVDYWGNYVEEKLPVLRVIGRDPESFDDIAHRVTIRRSRTHVEY